MLKKKAGITSFRIILAAFAIAIVIGTFFLMLPWAVKEGNHVTVEDALFTSVSAVCVTGLSIYDTASCWSCFGQIVIMALIQLGGIGVITAAASMMMLSGKKITLLQRTVMTEAVSAHKVGGIVKMTGFVVKIVFAAELAGAAIMSPVFCSRYGQEGLWMAMFHSVSAFCNGGFDIMGEQEGAFSSLYAFRDDVLVNIVLMALIITGGIGFLTWEDVRINKFHFKKYRLQTKVIILTTSVLIFFPALYFFSFQFEEEDIRGRLFASLFQSVTARTAGFSTVDISAMSETSLFIIMFLMFVGGSPGSTAGGIKTTTLAVLIGTTAAVLRRKDNTHFQGRKVEQVAVRNAIAVFMLYMSVSSIAGVIICSLERLPLSYCIFESVSALTTTGLSVGITPGLCTVSKIILTVLMFTGRVGGLTLIYAVLPGNPRDKSSNLPHEKITVG